jgi:transglutaminase-like putative cysteine protease
VNNVTDSPSKPGHDIPFIDEDTVDWSKVRRTRSLFYQRFHYAYPGPIHNLRQRLIVIPADQYGSQRVSSHWLSVDPVPNTTRHQIDRFGNRIVELEVTQAEYTISFEVVMNVENEAHKPTHLSLSDAKVRPFLKQTRLTRPDAAIREIASRLQREAREPRELAQKICDWVYATMQYQSAVTTVDTTAPEALRLGRGLCQDYAHLMLSICRTIGLPARYVSGHFLGEGGSHAWVEVLLPTDDGYHAVGFDPTNNCHPGLSYITVAVGRDYRDVSPTSGTFTAPYGGQLTFSKRAGLTFVEYLDGEVLQSPIL